MPLVVPDTGELRLLDTMLKLALSTNENHILKLFKSDSTPSAASAPGSFTEADFTGYAARTLSRSTWNAAVTVSNKAESSYGSSPQSWTCGATGNTVYGYWVEGSTSSTCLWAERFSTSRVLASGDVLNITPKFTMSSEN
jgi:hypothetical protein